MATCLAYASAFAPVPHIGNSRPSSSVSLIHEASEIATSASFCSSDMVLAGFNRESLGDAAKTIVIALAFGGGLIPAAIVANKSMIGMNQA